MSLDKAMALEILQQLIRIRTPQPVGDELDAVKYIVSLLDSDRFENRVLYHGNNRASLISELKGLSERPKMALIANLDTVGLEETAFWEHPPFAADYEKGRVFGRGAANNKGGATAVLLAALSLAADETPPPCDVSFCFTADNDKGAIGATAMIEGGFFEDIGELLFAQPTDCRIGTCQKGLIWLDVKISGRTSHVTKPAIGVNALDAFKKFYERIESLLLAEKPHALLGVPQCNVTKIMSYGPTQYSIPDKATGRIDIRFPPQIDVETLFNEIVSTAEDMCAKTENLHISLELVNKRAAIGMTPTAPVIRKLKKIYRKLKVNPELIGLPYFTDASVIIPKLGMPFVIVGPGEDIYGHSGDESIALDSVLLASKIYLEFIRNGASRM